MVRIVPSRLAPAFALLPIFAALPLAAQTTPTPAPPTPRPLPTRRPTPSPGVTPIPVRSSTTVNKLMLEGLVTGRPGRGDFFLRAAGMVYRVQPYDADLLRQIAGGDAVRVFGHADGLVITNANVRTLRNRASGAPDDYGPGNATDNR